jgi:hypothetical protein
MCQVGIAGNRLVDRRVDLAIESIQVPRKETEE